MGQFSNTEISLLDNHIDDHVDVEIQECLSSDPPKSFFIFAGAGSGKTRSLINTLEYLDKEKGHYLAERGKQIAVITYTNAACDEIRRRLQYKPIFMVSTIHSFLWEMIKNFQQDIRIWVETSIVSEIDDLQGKRKTGKRGSVSTDRAEKIISKQKRLEKIKTVKRFSYNPNGDNLGVDSLSHDEVIKIGSEFIGKRETMQEILVNKFPIMLIDESQDTKKELIDALLCVYENHKNWAIGMFGDTMQKIYMDGKDRLDEAVPQEWVFPKKVMNHRSASRIVDLANAVRKLSDGKEQRPRSDAKTGFVRLFIANALSDKEQTEKLVAEKMSEITCDMEWQTNAGYECLILEHHMAASRFSFSNLYTPLNESKEFDSALRKGEIAELSFLANTIIPLVKAHQAKNTFEIAKIVRQSSPLLSKKALSLQPDKQQQKLEQAEVATQSLFALWDGGKIPSCIDVLLNLKESGLYELSERMEEIIDSTYAGGDPKVIALKTALNVPFDEMERYAVYVSDQSRFATHQGVKGLEYPRVMVVLDDSEARGNWFSYEKLFGAKEKTQTDLKNEREGKDTGIQRTARLFYVACTRAMDSLAVVAYSENPTMVRSTALANGWFTEEEIVMLDGLVFDKNG